MFRLLEWRSPIEDLCQEKALQPKQIIGSQDRGPYATKVALGWIINGPVGRKLGKAMHASFFTRTEVHPLCAACSDFLDASDTEE